MQQLGEMRDSDPAGYDFMVMAFAEKNRRVQEELEKARNQ